MSLNNFKFSFSWLGLLAFLIPMIPNIFWAIAPQTADYLGGGNVPRPTLDMIEKITQGIMIFLLIVVVHKKGHLQTGRVPVAVITIACLVIYLGSWVIYYFGTITPTLILAMAIVPSLYFIFFALYQRNYYAMIFGILFGITHTIITTLNYVWKK